jgi:hypothetical protein
MDLLKENIHKYTGGLNQYLAETNNNIIYVDCSNQVYALDVTKGILNNATNTSTLL